MARQYAITDGTTTVSLINTGVTGIMADRGGLGPTSVNPDVVFNSPINADGATLGAYRYPPVVEEYRLNIFGSSEDQTALQLQQVLELVKKARQYNNIKTPWQRTPVYIISQTANETNTRYGLILAAIDWSIPDLFRAPFESDNEIEQFRITISRAPFWRASIPETLPAATPIGNAAYNAAIIADLGGSYDDLKRTEAAAINGDYGGAVAVDGATTNFWQFDFMVADASFSMEFEFDPNTLGMNDGSVVGLFHANKGGGGNVAWVYLEYTTVGGYRLRLLAYEDGGGNQNGTSDITDGPHTIRVEFTAATGPGNNDGITQLFVDDVLEVDKSAVDSDTLTVGLVKIGANNYSGTVTGGTLYFDDIKYADSTDENWHFTIDFENTSIVPVSNYNQQTQITHVYNYDDSLTAFSENIVGQWDATLFEVAGSTPAANDALYIGSDEGVFFTAAIIAAFAGVRNAALVTQYWDGGAWVTITAYSDIVIGTGVIGFSNPDNDWAQKVENGVNAYWLRIFLSSVTSWTSSPILARNIYSPQGTYIDIDQDAIGGDESPDSLLLLHTVKTTPNLVAWVIMGLKTRGLDNFNSTINLGGSNPTGWSEVELVDTTQVASGESPSGQVARCTFATDQDMVSRMTMILNAATIADYEGAYRIYLRVKQTAGNAGDVALRIKMISGEVSTGNAVFVREVNEGIELLDMGRFEILPQKLVSGEVAAISQLIDIQASSDNGTTPNIDIYSMELIPVDEWSFAARTTGDTPIGDLNSIQIDSGILRRGVMRAVSESAAGGAGSSVAFWDGEGNLPSLPTGRGGRLHFIFGADNGGILEAPYELSMNAELYNVEHWLHLRGAA
ncbi:MAG: hypothetical protein KAJ07_04745 [Planctomycetes bacterium]|nr:hypothetical protein [Planctomycetota bacterium]